jgi:hypothetical protein
MDSNLDLLREGDARALFTVSKGGVFEVDIFFEVL